MLNEIREMSLREVGVRAPGSYERGHRHRTRDESRDLREEDSRQRRREQESRRRHEEAGRSTAAGDRSRRAAEPRAQTRQIEHQSSLRSLLSSSEVDSTEMQTEILRQITEEGLLDGIDLDNLDVSQEDELSERIAEAYRRRHSSNVRSPRSRPEESREAGTGNHRPERDRARHRQRTIPQSEESTNHASHPPISRPHLFEAYPASRSQRHRTSSEHRRQPSPATAAARAFTDTQRQAARSATDLSDRPRTQSNVRDRPSEPDRRTTDPLRQRAHDIRRGRSSETPGASHIALDGQQANVPPSRSGQGSNQPSQPPSAPLQNASQPISSVPSVTAPNQTPYPLSDLIPQNTSNTASGTQDVPVYYHEPSIPCNRCGRSNLQYNLHYHCSLCSSGNFNLCLRCYRTGKGCANWFGFGKEAIARWDRHPRLTGDQLPHALVGRRYLPAPPHTFNPSDGRTTSNPKDRLQSGFFCAACFAFSNDCFWKCDHCNAGEWGFCNSCVNQGKHCTHPLLPVAHVSSNTLRHPEPRITHRTSAGHSFAPLPHSMSPPHASQPYPQQSPDFIPLTFSTSCNLCTRPISSSAARFHCPVCNDGDYDICSSCYPELVTSGRMKREDGDKGWRKCPQGHRVVVLGFDSSPIGQRRMVVRDLVGGHALKEDDSRQSTASSDQGKSWRWKENDTLRTATTQQNMPMTTATQNSFPPSGGTGIRATSLWSYYPQDGVQDELSFPKGAEIREAVDINGDWFWGIYCGKGGLWPGAYARVIT